MGSVDATTRVAEPELMDDPAQAAAYSEADFTQPHQQFVDEVAARFEELRSGAGVLLDAGCGPGDVTVRLARACPGWSIVGIDGAPEMLRLARDRVAGTALADRVRFEHTHLPSAGLLARRYDALASNSLLHHLVDPAALWDLCARVLPAGAPVAVMDLCRPATHDDLDAAVAAFPAEAPAVLRADFDASLRAAYRPDEVRAQLDAAGLGQLTVELTDEHHLLVTGRR